MPMELRKRKPAAEPLAAPPPKKKSTAPAKKKDDKSAAPAEEPAAADAEKKTGESAAPAKAVETKKKDGAETKKKDAPASKKGPASKAKAKKEAEEKAEDKAEDKPVEQKAEEKAEDTAEDKADAVKDATKTDDGDVDAKVAAAKDSPEEAKDDAAAKDAAKDPATAAASADIKEGAKLALETLGGEVLTNDGEKTTLHKLVEEAKKGVVIFTYPKASTPGCTNQACLFRDAYKPITDAGLSVFGLSTDSPKANTTFKDKKALPYPLLCDSAATLIGALGFKKAPRGTIRGVVVVDKAGTVVVHQAAGPAATVAAVQAVLEKFE